MVSFEEQVYWLGFTLIPGVGRKRIDMLLNAFGSLSRAWHASESEATRHGFNGAKLVAARQRVDLQAEYNKVKAARARLITLEDDDYPSLLKPLPDAPALLYVRGTLLPSDQRALAIVGTRSATPYGRDVTSQLAAELTRQWVTIISGLAQGIDTAAHTACLREGGRTIAVLGSGIDRIYPRENEALAYKIIENGALISEFPIGAPPEAHNFPRRNRVISGMALGVLIAEAPADSGALITASMAAEQGRDVFAVPSNIFNLQGVGANRLIQDGAKLVMSAEDILNELNLSYENLQTRRQTERIQPENELEVQVLAQLSADPMHVDVLARLTGLPISIITGTLAILELKGLAQSAGPMQYSLSIS